MQGDLLLQEWKAAKQICSRIIEICKMSHLGIGTATGVRVQLGSKQTSKEFMNVYNVVYRLCMTKEKEENRVQMVYKDYKDMLKMVTVEISKLMLDQKDIYRLNMLRKIWDCYCDIQKRLNNMFAYLNRPFHIKQGKIEDLDKTSSNVIIGALFMENSISEYEILYFKEIDNIRKKKDFSNQTILANLVDIFYKIHLKIIKQSSNKKTKTIFTEIYGHYQRKAKQYYAKQFKALQHLSPSEYFTHVHQIYLQEKQIAQNCFVITGQNTFVKEFADQFMHPFKSTLLTSQYGLKFIIKQGQIDILKLIGDLFMRLTKSVDGFKEQFEEYVFQEMKSYLDDNKVELTFKKSITVYCSFIQKIIRKNKDLLLFLDQMTKIGDFTHAYKNGMEKAFIHCKLSVQIQELLAIYTDTKFKLQLEQQQFQSQVKNIITIFNCIQYKDLFLLKYSQRLAKRVITISLIGINNNQVFVTNLKMNCGAKYTERLETILTQYRISNDYQDQLNEIQLQEKLPILLSLKVFSEGAWPTQSILEIPLQYLPKEINQASNCINIFKNEQLSKKSIKISGLQSKIRWTYFFDESLQTMNKICYFDTNCLQGAILFYIYRNRPNKIPLQFFEKMFKTTAKLLRENLNKMSDGKQKLLLRTTGEGQQQVYYEFNLKMMTTKKILQFDQGDNQQEQKLFQQNDLGKDREIIIDANISKLMKSRKILSYKSILEQVIKMIKIFAPQGKDIKMAIDRLISKQILERDHKDRQLIRYKD